MEGSLKDSSYEEITNLIDDSHVPQQQEVCSNPSTPKITSRKRVK